MTTLTSPLSDFVIFAGDAVTSSGPIDLTREGNRGRYYGNSSVFQDPLNFVGNNCENVSYDEPVNTAAQTLRSNLYNAIGFMTSEEGFPLNDTILPGIYTESGSISISNRNLVFDAQDDPNALFYIISGQAIMFEGVSSISLQNGAQYQNIYWFAGTNITFEGGFVDEIQGIFLAGSAITIDSNNTIFGNLYSNTGSITINSTNSGETTNIFSSNYVPPYPPPPPPGPSTSSDYTWIWPTLIGVLFVLVLLTSRRSTKRESTFF